MSVSAPHAPVEAWSVDAADFPFDASPRERLLFALRYAVLAPSPHNTQPWLFRVTADAVEVHADRTRALPVVDPHDRQLVMSCGAALFNLRVALDYLGERATVTVRPSDSTPDLLATVRLDGHAEAREAALFDAITRRRTNRGVFGRRSVPPDVPAALRHDADAEGAVLVALDDAGRTIVGELVAEGDRLQMRDRSFRRELAAWTHPSRTRSHDGMPGYTKGHGELMSALDPLVIRTFDTGDGAAARDLDIVAGSPLLVVLSTSEDEPAAWLAAGQALERVLLRATSMGVAASHLDQPIEVEALRERLRRLLALGGHPQSLLRLGYGPPAPPTPRRPVGDVLLDDAPSHDEHRGPAHPVVGQVS